MTLIQKNTEVVIDSSAWIEYFIGSEKGKRAVSYVESGAGLTPSIVIAELSSIYMIRNWPTWREDLNFICSRTSVAELTLEIAASAGITRQRLREIHKDASLADAIIIETAKTYKTAILTRDKHFKGMRQVIFLD